MLLFVLTAAFTCSKDSKIVDGELMTTYTYAQTQCADPWQTSQNDETTGRNVRQYLESKYVEVGWVRIERTSDGATCLACSCPSGKTIFVGAPKDENTRKALEKLGFKP